ncbi:MAG TPA: helix-turn-helix transcriptional regulator [Streptosporangiaceae bacterium]|nr:helix-turn-helix transcriptional regulator [Streptosporangiaceae bacterium]
MNVISAAQWASRGDHGGHDMPSPFIPGRLRELRAEAGLSQAELASKLGSDARQVSRYENGKVAPSLEAAVRIAETFNITLDYLLIPDAPRRPLRSPGGPIDAKLADLAHLTDDERATILAVIDAITTKARLRLITGNAS